MPVSFRLSPKHTDQLSLKQASAQLLSCVLLTSVLLLTACGKEPRPEPYNLNHLRKCQLAQEVDTSSLQRYYFPILFGKYELEYGICDDDTAPPIVAAGETLTLEFDWSKEVKVSRNGAPPTSHTYNTIRRERRNLIDVNAPVQISFYLETTPEVPELVGSMWVCDERLLFERYEDGGCGYGFRRRL